MTPTPCAVHKLIAHEPGLRPMGQNSLSKATTLRTSLGGFCLSFYSTRKPLFSSCLPWQHKCNPMCEHKCTREHASVLEVGVRRHPPLLSTSHTEAGLLTWTKIQPIRLILLGHLLNGRAAQRTKKFLSGDTFKNKFLALDLVHLMTVSYELCKWP